MRKAVLLCLLFLSLFTRAQTVSIQCDSVVCLNDFLVLDAQVSGTATAYAWNFGDGATSSQKSPLHNYSSTGIKTITLTVTLSGGSTLSDTRDVMVHDIPEAEFTTDLDPCFRSHQICLTDASDMGSTTSGYRSRLILWGDGARSLSNSPDVGDTICYSGYPKPGTYTLDVEVVNDKGCEDKWTQNVTILPDFEPSFKANSFNPDCKSQKFCFVNDSTPQRSDVSSWRWNFGDGDSTQGNWDLACHEYSEPGTYTVSFTVVLNNGCSITSTKQITVSFSKVETDINITDTVQCFPSTFDASTTATNGAFYIWKIYNADSTIKLVLPNASTASWSPGEPGDYFISIEVMVGACSDTSRLVPLRSRGVKASFLALNNKQCIIEDTVYMLNQSVPHPEARPSYFWNMDDDSAAQCTGYINNCNFDTAFHTQHWYADTGCYKIRLITFDTVSGCIDSAESFASLQELEDVTFGFRVEKPCIGTKTDYGLNYNYKACDLKAKVCIDSLADPTIFNPINATFKYQSVADPDGWVTVGFAMEGGDSRYYRSHDLNDFYVDSGRVCLDTVWYPNWYQIHPEPEVDFEVVVDSGCLPKEVSLVYQGESAGSLSFMKYNFDPGINVITEMIEDTVPTVKHTFTKPGYYDIFMLLQDSFGCYDYKYYPVTLGFFNSFTADTLICLGDTITLNDSIRYWQNATAYWRQAGNSESMTWDIDDGNGFGITTPRPRISFSSKGRFRIRLASVDSNGCADTVTHYVNVTGVNAAVKDGNNEYLCDQIIQLFDSSYLDSANKRDRIIEYHWDFGDGKTPSSLKDPFHYYSSSGTFYGWHAVRTESGCVDTVEFEVYLKGPEPYFDIISDTMGCSPFVVEFKSTSENVSSLVWKMGDPAGTSITMSRDTTFEFTYTEPGTYYIYLEGTDTFLNVNTQNRYTCSSLFPDTLDDVYRKIEVLPIPPVDFNFADPVCVGQPLTFIDVSDDAYTHYRWVIDGWDTLTQQPNYTHSFSDSGRYSVWLYPTYVPDSSYQRHCFDSMLKYVDVSYVEARFVLEDISDCSEFSFRDSSFNAVEHYWDFGHYISGDDNYSTELEPSHRYGRDSGTYDVCLIVKNTEGCADTACMEVEAKFFAGLRLYNVFTPNNDNLNDLFVLPGVNFESYHLQIFNRWGEMVFETTDPQQGWNGLQMNMGQQLPSSTYFYILHYEHSCTDAPERVEGVVELIRG